ncbi:MAG: MBL fold metallo-hydrolase [Solirubrobacteraceae bacterium]
MQLTVLGKSPAWQDVDGACSGYLLEEDGYHLLLECGNGVFGKLRMHVDYTDVDACVISHCHADHTLDLIPYTYALVFAPRQQPVPVPPWPGTDTPARPQLQLPPGGLKVMRTVMTAWGMPDLVERAFAASEYDPDEELVLGPLRLRFRAVPHFVPAYAVEIRSTVTGGRFVYGSDCAPNEDLVTFATGADLFMVEATLPRPERTGPRGHLTPSEAAEHARRAGVGRAVLTHISDEQDRGVALEQATAAAGDVPVELAEPGARYTI